MAMHYIPLLTEDPSPQKEKMKRTQKRQNQEMEREP